MRFVRTAGEFRQATPALAALLSAAHSTDSLVSEPHS